MIPPTLEAFRALMRDVAPIVSRWAYETGDAEARQFVASLEALATATSAQLCGIAGESRRFAEYSNPLVNIKTGDYIVTPREES